MEYSRNLEIVEVTTKDLCGYGAITEQQLDTIFKRYGLRVWVEKDKRKGVTDTQKVSNLVIYGLEQIKAGKTKEFNSVCDRLGKKYSSLSL